MGCARARIPGRAVHHAFKIGKGSSPSVSGRSAPKAPTPVSAKPRAAPPVPAASTPTPKPILGTGSAPPTWNPGEVDFGFDLGFWIPARPLVLAPDEDEEDPWDVPDPSVLAPEPDAPPVPQEAPDTDEPPLAPPFDFLPSWTR